MHPPMTFDLVSPERLLFSKHVSLVTIPGTEGDFGVLVDHAPLIATVRPGVIEVYPHGQDHAPSDRLFVSGGFAEVTPTRCTVLADEAIPVGDLNRAALEAQKKTLAEKIATVPEEERAHLLIQQEVVLAKIQAAN